MFRRTLRLAPLISQQSTRGLATQEIKQYAQTKGRRFAHVALVELTPPTPAELPQAFRDGISLYQRRKNWRNVTVKEAFVNAIITTEVLCWFFVGECIGKGTIIGYQV